MNENLTLGKQISPDEESVDIKPLGHDEEERPLNSLLSEKEEDASIIKDLGNFKPLDHESELSLKNSEEEILLKKESESIVPLDHEVTQAEIERELKMKRDSVEKYFDDNWEKMVARPLMVGTFIGALAGALSGFGIDNTSDVWQPLAILGAIGGAAIFGGISSLIFDINKSNKLDKIV
jgi:hypothetical protein